MTSIVLQTHLHTLAASPSAVLYFPATSQWNSQTIFFLERFLTRSLELEKVTHPDITRLRGGVHDQRHGWLVT